MTEVKIKGRAVLVDGREVMHITGGRSGSSRHGFHGEYGLARVNPDGTREQIYEDGSFSYYDDAKRTARSEVQRTLTTTRS
jgi:hypothetical protein